MLDFTLAFADKTRSKGQPSLQLLQKLKQLEMVVKDKEPLAEVNGFLREDSCFRLLSVAMAAAPGQSAMVAAKNNCAYER